MDETRREYMMGTQVTLYPVRVRKIFEDCLSRDDEDTSEHIRAEGVTKTVGFHLERLESHREEIEAMLSELPDEFQESSGEGWSFLEAHNDKHGNQWTGLHPLMEQLFQLGIGIGKVECPIPWNMRNPLSGRMPYYIVKS